MSVNEDRYWELIDGIGGAVSRTGLLRLGDQLKSLGKTGILAFHEHLERSTAALQDVRLCHPDGAVGVGDARRALELATVAAGRERYEEILATTDEDVVLGKEVGCALEIDDLIRESYESLGEAWPNIDVWRDVGGRQVVTAYFPREDTPDNACIRAMRQSLARVESSPTYQHAVSAAGFHAMWCLGWVRDADPDFAGPRGSRWRSRVGNGVIEVDFFVDLDAFDVDDAAAGEAFVRGLIDYLSRRHSLPKASDVLGKP